MTSSQSFVELLKAIERTGVAQFCGDCDGGCCRMPWVTCEELTSGQLPREHLIQIGSTNFIRHHDRCECLTAEGRCSVYHDRPIDCRLFPLDIIELNDGFHWCVFRLCRNWEQVAAAVQPHLKKLELCFSVSLWQQFREQIRVTKTLYPPYRDGGFVVLKKFEPPEITKQT